MTCPVSTSGSSVHPHACGEHCEGCCEGGSSPRLWGTRNQMGTVLQTIRFIPTPVGNTSSDPFHLWLDTVHPHACGEHCNFLIADCPDSGSSPRLWGTHTTDVKRASSDRFIPTPVGNTTRAPFAHQVRPVHPHACGEHNGQSDNNNAKGGSSPRLWGTLTFHGKERGGMRFIPTPVGNTEQSGRMHRQDLVHPHACGEHP